MGTAGRVPARPSRCRAVMSERPGPDTSLGGAVRPWPLGEPPPAAATPRWAFAIAAMATTGRISLPTGALGALGVEPGSTVRGFARGDRLVLHHDCAGRPVTIDARGRLTLPVWLRRAAHPTCSVLIATSLEAGVVVVVPISALEAVADVWGAGR